MKSNELIVAPVFYGTHHSEGNIWKSNNDYTTLGGWGIVSKYKINKLSIKLDFYNNRIYNINKRPNYFSKDQGLSWFKRADHNSNPNGNIFDFDVSNVKINYNANNTDFYFGKFSSHWGPGESSIVLSNKSPSFSKFGFKTKINSKLNFEYFHGSLKSLISDSLNTNYYNQNILGGTRDPNLNRYIAAHRIDIKLLPYLDIGLNEMVIYGVRGLDLFYCIPFLPFWSLQHYLGDLDNIIMSADFKLKINQKLKLYGALLIDEWTPSLTFDKKENRNWFGYQAGLELNNLIFKDDIFITEFNWADHRIYRHRFNINDFYSHGYPIGFWGGPHSEELFLSYKFNKFSYLFSFEFSDSKRGILSEEMLENQYSNNNENFERFSDGYEKISNLEIRVSKKIYKALIGHVGINIIKWENANFDPYNYSNQNLIDVSKNSFFFSLSYNFDIKKQNTYIDKESIAYKMSN